MESIIRKLEEMREDTVIELKKGNQEFLKIKLEIDRAILCLKFCDEYGLFNNSKDKYEVIELPFPSGAGYFSDYRIVDDCEGEDEKYWREIEVNGKIVLLSPLDIVIKK